VVRATWVVSTKKNEKDTSRRCKLGGCEYRRVGGRHDLVKAFPRGGRERFLLLTRGIKVVEGVPPG